MRRLAVATALVLLATLGAVVAPSVQAAAPTPIRAAFYYPWFPETTAGRYHPTLGKPYDSGNVAVVQAHIYEMAYAGITAGIASWWGPGTPTDGRMNTLLAGAVGTGFRWTAYYEQEGYSDPSAATLSADLTSLARYASNPSWLQASGKPVLFVYAGPTDGCAMVDRWTQANAGRFYLVLKVFGGYTACARQPDSWHQYAPAVAADRQGAYSYSISPGFWPGADATARLSRDPARFAANVRDMVASGTQWQLVTTFNEWGEGSSVEPATEWGSTWLDILRTNGAGVLPSPSPTSTSPTPTPSVTGSPSSTPSPSVTTSPSASPTPSPSSSSSPTPTPTPTPSVTPPPPGSPLVVIYMENHERSQIVGSSSAPYMNSLRASGLDFTRYYGVAHPSLPNYLALANGSTDGKVGTDSIRAGELTQSPTLWNQLSTKGVPWIVYEESMPSVCYSGSSSGGYVLKHNPATPFASIFNSPLCQNVKPYSIGSPLVAGVNFIAPNLCNDTHDCSIATGDSWLKRAIPPMLAAGATVVLTYDEGDTSTNGGGNIYTVVARTGITPRVITTTYNHYSLLRAIEDRYGLTRLGAAASAAALPLI